MWLATEKEISILQKQFLLLSCYRVTNEKNNKESNNIFDRLGKNQFFDLKTISFTIALETFLIISSVSSSKIMVVKIRW